jgi:hypothetical protein
LGGLPDVSCDDHSAGLFSVLRAEVTFLTVFGLSCVGFVGRFAGNACSKKLRSFL